MRGTIWKNGPILGGSIGITVFTISPYAAFLVMTRTADPVPWGLLMLAMAVTSMMAYVGAEIASAIRERRP